MEISPSGNETSPWGQRDLASGHGDVSIRQRDFALGHEDVSFWLGHVADSGGHFYLQSKLRLAWAPIHRGSSPQCEACMCDGGGYVGARAAIMSNPLSATFFTVSRAPSKPAPQPRLGA